jgi:hypothetical protein
MAMRKKFLCIVAALLPGATGFAQQWFSVVGPDSRHGTALVEIDLETVRIRSQGGDGVIRLSFDAPQPHASGFGYRSLVATAQFDCQRRMISLTSSAYFALPGGKGQRLGADSSGRETGMPPDLLEKIPAAARQAILKAACATPPS